MRERVQPLQKLEKPARKVSGEVASLWCPLFEFWKGGTRSHIFVLGVFAKGSIIIISDDNTVLYGKTSINKF